MGTFWPCERKVPKIFKNEKSHDLTMNPQSGFHKIYRIRSGEMEWIPTPTHRNDQWFQTLVEWCSSLKFGEDSHSKLGKYHQVHPKKAGSFAPYTYAKIIKIYPQIIQIIFSLNSRPVGLNNGCLSTWFLSVGMFEMARSIEIQTDLWSCWMKFWKVMMLEITTVDMVHSLSRYLQDFLHPRWLAGCLEDQQ